MAIYTSPYVPEVLPGTGVTPRWFIHRWKAEMNNNEAAAAELGTAADHGYDPAIDSVPYATEGTLGICNFPTHREWSAGQTAMLFHFKIDHNTADNMTVDVSWYEACYGTTGAVERWRFIATDYGITDDDTRQIGTDGGRVFCHIDAIHNPDGDAHLTVYARGASAVQIVGMGGGEAGGTIIDEGVEAIGAKVWDSTLTPPRWVKCDITTILAAVADLDDVIEDHDAVLAEPDTLKVGGMARTTLVGAAVAAGDVCRITTSVNGGVLAAGYDAANTTTRDLPIETNNNAASGLALPVGGLVDTTIPAAYADGDMAEMWMEQHGAQVIAGYDAANTTARPLPVENRADACAGIGVPVGGLADTTIPAAVADAEFVPLWMEPHGAVTVAGYDTANTVARPIPVENMGDAASGLGIPVGGRVDATLPAAVADGEFTPLWLSVLGSPVVSGYDAANVFPRPLPVEAHDAANQGVGVPVVGRAESTIPAAVADGDTVFPWISTTGVQVIGGYDVTGAVSRVLPVEASGVVSSATGVVVGGVADSTIPAAVHDTDFVPAWMSINGAQVVAGYSSNSTAAMLLPVEQNSTASSGTGIPVGGLCEATLPAARLDGNFSALWMDLYGAAVIAGYDPANTIARPLPIGNQGDAVAGYGLQTVLRAESTVPAAVLDGEAVLPWANLSGAQVIAGYDLTTNSARVLPVELRGVVSGDVGIPIGGVAESTVPADVHDTDFVPLWMTLKGAAVVAGYDLTSTVARPLPVETRGNVSADTSVLVGGVAESTAPADVHDTDAVPLWSTLKGAVVIAGYDASAAATSRTLPVEVTDGVSQNTGVPVGAKAFAGVPAAVADGDFTLITTDLTGSQRAHLTQGLDYTTSSVECREKPPTGLSQGTSNIAAAATALNSGTSLACVRVHVQALDTNLSYIMVGGSGVTVTTGIKLFAGDAITIEIDDVAKVYGYAASANDDLQWLAETR